MIIDGQKMLFTLMRAFVRGDPAEFRALRDVTVHGLSEHAAAKEHGVNPRRVRALVRDWERWINTEEESRGGEDGAGDEEENEAEENHEEQG